MTPLQRRRFLHSLQNAEKRVAVESRKERHKRQKSGFEINLNDSGSTEDLQHQGKTLSTSTQSYKVEEPYQNIPDALNRGTESDIQDSQEGKDKNPKSCSNRVLNVESAARLFEESDCSSPLIFSAGAWVSAPMSDSDEISRDLSSMKNMAFENFHHCIDPIAADDEEEILENEQGKDYDTDFENLNRLCNLLSLNNSMSTSCQPENHICARYASPQKDEVGMSRFYTNVAKVETCNSTKELDALDSWIHHFVTEQKDPYRVAVLLLGKASICKNSSLMFPTIAQGYLSERPPYLHKQAHFGDETRLS